MAIRSSFPCYIGESAPYGNKESERIQQSLKREIGQWNCKHTIFPVVLGVSPRTYTGEQLAEMRDNSTERITVDGNTMSRYQWSQQMRKLETQMRYARDDLLVAKAMGDKDGEKAASGRIDALMDVYNRVATSTKIPQDYSRTWLDRMGGVVKSPKNSLTVGGGNGIMNTKNIVFSSKQFGSKSGKHMGEWGLNPSVTADREKFKSISQNIIEHADRMKKVKWQKNPDTGKRDVEVYAYILGEDVVLVGMDNKYITTMKNGARNTRVIGGTDI